MAGLGVDDEGRLLYLYAEPPRTTGAVAINRCDSGRIYSVSCATAFLDTPSFRFDIRRQYPVALPPCSLPQHRLL